MLREGGDGDLDPESFFQLNGRSALYEFAHDANLGEASVHGVWNRWVRAATPDLKEVGERCECLVWSLYVELAVWFMRVQPVHAVLVDANVRWNFCGGSVWQFDRELRVDVIRRIMTAEVTRDRTDVLAESTNGICNGYAVLISPRACGGEECGGENSNKPLLHAAMIAS